jgi:hypothetical protein
MLLSALYFNLPVIISAELQTKPRSKLTGVLFFFIFYLVLIIFLILDVGC